MDAFNEKKWFLYVVDHHEGPFSLADIEQKMAQGQATASSYIWCEGMPDWKMASDVQAFEALLKPSTVPPAPPELKVVSVEEPVLLSPPQSELEASTESPSLGTPSLEMISTDQNVHTLTSLEPAPEELKVDISEALASSSAQQEVNQISQTVVEKEQTADLDTKERKAAEKAAKKAAKQAEKEKRRLEKEANPEKGSLSILIKVLILVVISGGMITAYVQGLLDPVLNSPALKATVNTASDFTRPYIVKAIETVPALGKVISPIPRLEDVPNEDYEELKATSLANLTSGPKAALSLSRSDLFTPFFYVTSNLPDGTKFNVIVEGVSDTLLNHLVFNQSVEATLAKRFAKTAMVRFPDNRPLPRGEYNVYLIESENQPDATKGILANAQPSGIKIPPYLPKGSRIIAKKTYFLGGTKDSTYLSRLKEYHDKLRTRATAELAELKQFSGTLESQLNASITNFSKLRKGRIIKQQQLAWGKFNTKWSQLDSQMNESFQQWTQEILSTQYFYGMIYSLLQQASQAVAQMHGLHHAYFTGAVDKTSFDIQLGQAVSQAQTAVTTVKAKIEQAETLAPTANGMPRREGL